MKFKFKKEAIAASKIYDGRYLVYTGNDGKVVNNWWTMKYITGSGNKYYLYARDAEENISTICTAEELYEYLDTKGWYITHIKPD